MSNSFSLVSKGDTAPKALLHWQFHAAAVKLLSGQKAELCDCAGQHRLASS